MDEDDLKQAIQMVGAQFEVMEGLAPKVAGFCKAMLVSLEGVGFTRSEALQILTVQMRRMNQSQ